MQDTREIVSENILGMVLAVLISVCFVPLLIPHFLDAFSVNVINTFPAFMSSAFLCVHFDLNQTWNCILPGKKKKPQMSKHMSFRHLRICNSRRLLQNTLLRWIEQHAIKYT